MPNFNLTTQEIKDTYEQLAQVSASLLVDGTGSLSPIVTSSIIDFPTEVSRSAAAAGFGSIPSGVISSSAQVVYSGITGVPSGILSSSTQIATDISGAFTSTSASLAANIATNTTDIGTLTAATSSYALKTEISGAFTSTSASLAANIATNTSNITTKLDTSTFTSYSSSVSTRLTTDEGNISTNTSNISTQTSRVDSLVSATSSYAVKSANNTFSGTQTFLNIAVSGTASIAYVEQVTGSAVVIGEEFIILNTSVPAARYAGIKVYDTGSTESTASFIFDGLTNDWFYQYSGSDGTDFGVVLFGPEYSTIGTPSYPTSNQIQKGTGGHHLTGSNISDNGTLVSVSTPFTATQITASTGFKGNLDGNATTATSASYAQTSSFANEFNVATNLKVGNSFSAGGSNPVTNTNSLSFGSGNTIGADNSMIIGAENNTNNAQYCAIVGAAASTISAGDTSVILGGYQNTINGGLRNIIIGGNQVINGQDFSVVLGKQSFTATQAYTTYVNNFESTGSLNHSGSVQVVGSITSSIGFSGDGSGLTNVTALSASYAQTSSFAAGNFQVDGQIFSPVFSGSVASSTSSIDFDNGNFAVLTLTSATHIANPSNIKSGTTYTLIINSGSLAASYGTSFKFAGGTAPTLSEGVDIVTMVSDGSRLFATGLANFS